MLFVFASPSKTFDVQNVRFKSRYVKIALRLGMAARQPMMVIHFSTKYLWRYVVDFPLATATSAWNVGGDRFQTLKATRFQKPVPSLVP